MIDVDDHQIFPGRLTTCNPQAREELAALKGFVTMVGLKAKQRADKA